MSDLDASIDRVRRTVERNRQLDLLLAALAQALFDSETHPDGPMLSTEFYELLDEAGVRNEVERRARELR